MVNLREIINYPILLVVFFSQPLLANAQYGGQFEQGEVICNYEESSIAPKEFRLLVFETGFSDSVSITVCNHLIKNFYASTNRNSGVVLGERNEVMTIKLPGNCDLPAPILILLKRKGQSFCFDLFSHPNYKLIYLSYSKGKLSATYSNVGRNYK